MRKDVDFNAGVCEIFETFFKQFAKLVGY